MKIFKDPEHVEFSEEALPECRFTGNIPVDLGECGYESRSFQVVLQQAGKAGEQWPDGVYGILSRLFR